jgi:hypothetical protein
MDRRKLDLLDALRTGAQQRGEIRLYRRGKLPGLFGQRTQANAEIANHAIKDGLLEVIRTETVGKTVVEWVRVTPRGLDFLVEHESPLRALEDLREMLAINQEGLPLWIAEFNTRVSDQVRRYVEEVRTVSERIDYLSRRVIEAIDQFKEAHAAPPPTVSWAQVALDCLTHREQVGLGPRCPLAELFAVLKEKHSALTLKEFHAGLKIMQDGSTIRLLPGSGSGDTPGPEYALLDGAVVYYYVARVKGTPSSQ